MKPHTNYNGLTGLLMTIIALAIATATSYAQTGQKVSERTSLAAEALDPATDLLPIVDVSAGAAGSKKMTPNAFMTGWGATAAGESVLKAATAAAQRSALGLGTAATLDHGTANGNLVRLDPTTGKLPAVDGSLLTNLPSTGPAGPSAYEVAVAEGFVGDEAAWLASLQGIQGEQGEPGAGAPAGGTTGQVLAKASPTDYDYTWTTNGTVLTDSASLRNALSNETGSGAAVFGTSPTIASPVINVGSDATGDILYRGAGGGLTRLGVGTNGHVLTLAAGVPSWAPALTDSASLSTMLSDETGSGAAVFGTSPTIATPTITSPTITLGSDAAGDIFYRGAGGGLTRLAAGTNGHVLTLAAGVPSWAPALTDSASLRTMLSDETGSGAAVFATSPTITSPTINLGSDATGDIYYRGAGGGLTRLAAGTNGHVLTLSSGVPSWAAASGGGLTNWTDAISTASPNNFAAAASLTATGSDTNIDAVIAPKGDGALLVDVPNNASTGGNKRGGSAVDLQVDRAADTQVASGANSVILGGSNNTASGALSTISGGTANTASSVGCFVGGGTTNTSSANYAVVTGGASNTASGSHSVVAGGESNTASGSYASVLGGLRATTRGLYGSTARAAGMFDVTGDAQTHSYILRGSVANNTPAEIALGNQTLGSSTRIVLPNNSAYSFRANAVATKTDGTSKAWRMEGTIKRGNDASTTALVGTVTTTSSNGDTGTSGWDVTLSADTTNGSLKVEVTGDTTGTTRFIVHVDTVGLVF